MTLSIPRRAGYRSIYETVTEHCRRLGLCPQQIEICLEVAYMKQSSDEGKSVADRIHGKMIAIRTRLGTRPQ